MWQLRMVPCCPHLPRWPPGRVPRVPNPHDGVAPHRLVLAGGLHLRLDAAERAGPIHQVARRQRPEVVAADHEQAAVFQPEAVCPGTEGRGAEVGARDALDHDAELPVEGGGRVRVGVRCARQGEGDGAPSSSHASARTPGGCRPRVTPRHCNCVVILSPHTSYPSLCPAGESFLFACGGECHKRPLPETRSSGSALWHTCKITKRTPRQEVRGKRTWPARPRMMPILMLLLRATAACVALVAAVAGQACDSGNIHL